ncbi:COG4223 family protein [Salibaculum halophilum]|uniref:COG4223 family protein n=1 Tax=Salibaculum halophilum TaxID=1914408 RepID=UPI0015C44F3F|nr:hypothetical protein [Salibaculum halophilum]
MSSATDNDAPPEAIEDAEIVEQTPPDSGSNDAADDGPVSTGKSEPASVTDDVPEAAPVPPHVDPMSDDNAPDTETAKENTPNDAMREDVSPVEDTSDVAPDGDPPEEDIPNDPVPARSAASQHASQPASATPEQPARRRGGFVPLLIGGLAAGGIGYGVETYLDRQAEKGPDLAALIEDQSERMDALGAEIDAIPPNPDLAPLQDRLDGLEQDLTRRIDAAESDLTERIDMVESDLTERIDGLDERLTQVEKRPQSDGTLSDSAMAAYERELDALRAELATQRDQLATQRDEVTAIAEQAAEDLKAARAEAEQLEQQAVEEARAAAGRAALNRLRVAVSAGDPFEDLLGDLTEVAGELPKSLTEVAETGVAERATLEEEFDSAARAALAAAREEGVAGETGGLGTFLRQQFDVRSTQPRAGDDPDAVLSRAEAAVEEDRLSDALDEIAALPEVARAEMTGWIAKAKARADALAAIADLSQSLNTN